MTNFYTTLRAAVVWRALPLATTLMLTACGGGGGSSDDRNAPATISVAGAWNVTEVESSNCKGEEHRTKTYQAVITQDGTTLRVQTPVGTFSGEIHGHTLWWSGSYAEEGGTTTIQQMELTADVSGAAFKGESRWKYSDGSESCSGTTHSTGTHL